METKYLGTVRVPISRLTFNPSEDLEPDERCSYQREQLLRLDPKFALQLANIFRQGKCRPSALDNQISGIVTLEGLQRILTLLNISKQELLVLSLKQPLEACEKDSYPFIDGDFTIWCVHGRRRAEAADMAFGKKAWWTVKLFYKSTQSTGAIKFNDFVRIENEKYSHEAAYSDGAVYRKVKHYLNRGQIAEVHSWLTKLSFPKRKGFRSLLESESISQAFDGLLPFVGLWGGLRLGNVHKHLARHFDELIVLYCSHVSDVWSFIFGLHTQLKDFLDLESVQLLEGKAPSVCSDDKRLIEEAMKDGSLLPLISDARIRKEIASNILKVTGIIPSIATLHKNLCYFGFGAQILQKHVEVLPTKLRKERLTLYQNLRNDWRAPSKTKYRLGDETITVLNPTPEVSFVILFLAALRDFPYLSRESPLKGRRDEKLGGYVKEHCRKRLLRLAVRLGFYNHKLQEDSAGVPLEAPSEDATAEPQHWRYGTPSTQTFKALKNVTFLHQLYGLEKRSDELTPGFVLNDLVRAFFGKFRVFDANGEPLTDCRVRPLNVHIRISQFPCTIMVNAVKILKQISKPYSKNRVAKVSRPQSAAAKSKQLHEALKRQESTQNPASISLDSPEKVSTRFRKTVIESSNEFTMQRGRADSTQVKGRSVPLKFQFNPTRGEFPPWPHKPLSKRPLQESTGYGKEIRTRLEEEPLRKRRRLNSEDDTEEFYELVGDVPETDSKSNNESELQNDTQQTSRDKEPRHNSWLDNQSVISLHAIDLTGESSNESIAQVGPAAPTREKRRSLHVPLKFRFNPTGGEFPPWPHKLLSKRPLQESTGYGKEIRTRLEEEPLRKRRRLNSEDDTEEFYELVGDVPETDSKSNNESELQNDTQQTSRDKEPRHNSWLDNQNVSILHAGKPIGKSSTATKGASVASAREARQPIIEITQADPVVDNQDDTVSNSDKPAEESDKATGDASVFPPAHIQNSDQAGRVEGYNTVAKRSLTDDISEESGKELPTQVDPAAPTREKRRSVSRPLKVRFNPNLEGLAPWPKEGKEKRLPTSTGRLSKRGLEESAGFHEEIREQMGEQRPRKRPRRDDSIKNGTLLSTTFQPQAALEDTSSAPTGATTPLRREGRRSVQSPFRYMTQLDLEKTLSGRKQQKSEEQQQLKRPFSDVSEDFDARIRDPAENESARSRLKRQRRQQDADATAEGASPIVNKQPRATVRDLDKFSRPQRPAAESQQSNISGSSPWGSQRGAHTQGMKRRRDDTDIAPDVNISNPPGVSRTDFKWRRYRENLLAIQSGATPGASTEESSGNEPTAVVSPVHDRDGGVTEPLENWSSQNRTYSPARDALHGDSNSSQHVNRSSTKEPTPVFNRRAGGFFDGYSRNQPEVTSPGASPGGGIIDLGAIAQMQSEQELFPLGSGTDQDEPAAHVESPQSISPISNDSEL